MEVYKSCGECAPSFQVLVAENAALRKENEALRQQTNLKVADFRTLPASIKDVNALTSHEEYILSSPILGKTSHLRRGKCVSRNMQPQETSKQKLNSSKRSLFQENDALLRGDIVNLREPSQVPLVDPDETAFTIGETSERQTEAIPSYEDFSACVKVEEELCGRSTPKSMLELSNGESKIVATSNSNTSEESFAKYFNDISRRKKENVCRNPTNTKSPPKQIQGSAQPLIRSRDVQNTSFDRAPQWRKSPSPKFKYRSSPVRKKSERRLLEGWTCSCCAPAYKLLLGPGQGAADEKQLIDRISRHRGKYPPPKSPEGYWNLSLLQ